MQTSTVNFKLSHTGSGKPTGIGSTGGVCPVNTQPLPGDNLMQFANTL